MLSTRTRFTLTNEQRIRYSKIAVSLSLIVIFAISYKLWLNVRNYPLAPVFDWFPSLPSPFDYLQPLLAVVLLVQTATARNARVPSFLFFGLFWLLVLGDQNRLQPYCFMFAFMLIVISGYKNDGDSGQEKNVLNTLRVIVICIYLWAAIHKLNPSFMNRFLPFMTGIGYDTVAKAGFWKYFILLVPLTEFLIAVGLMLNRTRRLALYCAVFMHFAIIVLLSPKGIGWNYVVIPWNLGMIALDIFLFRNAEAFSLSELWSPKKSWMKAAVILLFFIMPIFNLFGHWDHYVSASLYSFKTPYARIHIDQTLLNRLPAYLGPYYGKDADGAYIEVIYWTVGELHVLPYPEERVYKQVRDFICTFDTRDTCGARLELYH